MSDAACFHNRSDLYNPIVNFSENLAQEEFNSKMSTCSRTKKCYKIRPCYKIRSCDKNMQAFIDIPLKNLDI